MENFVLEQRADASNLLSHKRVGDEGFCSKIQMEEKKLKLFGFEVDPHAKGGQCRTPSGGDDSVYSLGASSSRVEKIAEGKSSSCQSEHKYGCQFCLKEFANLQALGGHQNAHKKERRKKKRMQLEARRISSNFYFQSLQSHGGFIYHNSPLWFNNFVPFVPEFVPFEESQVSYISLDHNQNTHPSQSQTSNSIAFHNHIQDDTLG